MKDNKEYSKKINELYRPLKRKYPKVEKVTYDEPTDALVYAFVSENATEAAAQSTMRRFADYFVDLNDLRVSRIEEIVEILGEDTPVTRDTASRLTSVLRVIFEKYSMVTLGALKKIGKRQARETLEKIDGISPFVVDYCMLTSLQGHAIPLTAKMIDYLKTNQMVHPDANYQQIEGFLARQILAKNAYRFYALLRCRSESGTVRTKARRKTARQPKAETRTEAEKK